MVSVKVKDLKLGDVVCYKLNSGKRDGNPFSDMIVVKADDKHVEMVRPYVRLYGYNPEATEERACLSMEPVLFHRDSTMEFFHLGNYFHELS
jgi:hypothetical protein